MRSENHVADVPRGCLPGGGGVARVFKSAADCDVVWERFLPHNFREIVSRAHSPLAFSSKKQLYFLLHHSALLLDEGKLLFGLTAKGGKNWYTLGARRLKIMAIDDPKYWEWTSLPESSFTEVAKLRSARRLEISGTMEARMLSPNTKLTVYDGGLDVPSKASIKFVEEDGTKTEGENNIVYLAIPKNHPTVEVEGRLSWAVEDDWYEIELGEFLTGEGDNYDVHIEVSETERLNLKKGLVIEGIALRPKDRYKWGYEGFEDVLPPGFIAFLDAF